MSWRVRRWRLFLFHRTLLSTEGSRLCKEYFRKGYPSRRSPVGVPPRETFSESPCVNRRYSVMSDLVDIQSRTIVTRASEKNYRVVYTESSPLTQSFFTWLISESSMGSRASPQDCDIPSWILYAQDHGRVKILERNIFTGVGVDDESLRWSPRTRTSLLVTDLTPSMGWFPSGEDPVYSGHYTWPPTKEGTSPCQ